MIKENQRLLNQLNVLSDGALVFLSVFPAYWIRFCLFDGTPSFPLRSYLWLGAIAMVLFLATYAIAGQIGRASCRERV